MPNINDRIGSQNVIRVLSNASAPPTRLVDLSDVDSTLKTRDGMILVWDLPTENFYMTDTIDSSTLVATGIVTFSNTTNSLSPTTGALIVNGGIGVGKNIIVGGGLSVSGVSTFNSDVDINASVDILDNLVINGTLESVGITTLSSNGGITTTGGDLFTKDNLTVGNNLYVKGTSEFIGVATFRGGTISIGDSIGDDINIGGEFISDLNPNDDATYDIGIDSKRWKNARFSGLVTTNNLFVSGVSTFTNNIDINGDVKITGFASVTEGIYYDSNDYNGPNGIAYFDNTGRLIGAASTENALTETYFILTTNAVGIPTWTSVIDGGEF